ncbi:unnamed protein product, partial [Ectocarpus sp. 12 AP-2014]
RRNRRINLLRCYQRDTFVQGNYFGERNSEAGADFTNGRQRKPRTGKGKRGIVRSVLLGRRREGRGRSQDIEVFWSGVLTFVRQLLARCEAGGMAAAPASAAPGAQRLEQVVELFQNQRYRKFKGWSSRYLLNSDPGRYSDHTGGGWRERLDSRPPAGCVWGEGDTG